MKRASVEFQTALLTMVLAESLGEPGAANCVPESPKRTVASLRCRVRRPLATLCLDSSFSGLAITVCQLPPGTSKWNKIEHRLFSHISMNWRERPLTSHLGRV